MDGVISKGLFVLQHINEQNVNELQKCLLFSSSSSIIVAMLYQCTYTELEAKNKNFQQSKKNIP